jgi:SAM-dependent methyltransferase
VGITKFIGIDTSEATIAVARKEFGDERVLQIDAFKFLTSSQESFDLISAIDFIEHVSKDELYRLMDAILESLHPEGLLLCRIPNGNGLFGMASRYNDITHETCFTPVSITDVMERSGFDVLRIWEDQGSPTSLAQLFHWGAWQAVRFFIRCIDAIETGDWGDGVLTRNMWVLAWKSRNGKA